MHRSNEGCATKLLDYSHGLCTRQIIWNTLAEGVQTPLLPNAHYSQGNTAILLTFLNVLPYADSNQALAVQ